MNITRTLIAAFGTTLLASFSLAAAAQSVDVKCEVRSDRSRASVDGENLASGNYSAVLISGSNTAQSPYEATRGDEVEFDFDSNRRDIRQGATAIDQDFIVNRRVTGQLLDVAGRIVAQRTVRCEKK